ncbi:MAG: hypothetical protein OEX19_10640, partial [Gammaproteobacteria bacterium]|nr:hypothetical protein [Gammaproteobacteria bacterium]
VEVSQIQTETRTETDFVDPSIENVSGGECDELAAQAERENLFGLRQAEPENNECSQGDPPRTGPFARCNYRSN